jgi:hypothetical protein
MGGYIKMFKRNFLKQMSVLLLVLFSAAPAQAMMNDFLNGGSNGGAVSGGIYKGTPIKFTLEELHDREDVAARDEAEGGVKREEQEIYKAGLEKHHSYYKKQLIEALNHCPISNQADEKVIKNLKFSISELYNYKLFKHQALGRRSKSPVRRSVFPFRSTISHISRGILELGFLTAHGAGRDQIEEKKKLLIGMVTVDGRRQGGIIKGFSSVQTCLEWNLSKYPQYRDKIFDYRIIRFVEETLGLIIERDIFSGSGNKISFPIDPDGVQLPNIDKKTETSGNKSSFAWTACKWLSGICAGVLAIFCGVKIYRKIKEKYSKKAIKNGVDAFAGLENEEQIKIMKNMVNALKTGSSFSDDEGQQKVFKNFWAAFLDLPEEKRSKILESLKSKSGLEKEVFKIFMRQSYEHVKEGLNGRYVQVKNYLRSWWSGDGTEQPEIPVVVEDRELVVEGETRIKVVKKEEKNEDPEASKKSILSRIKNRAGAFVSGAKEHLSGFKDQVFNFAGVDECKKIEETEDINLEEIIEENVFETIDKENEIKEVEEIEAEKKVAIIPGDVGGETSEEESDEIIYREEGGEEVFENVPLGDGNEKKEEIEVVEENGQVLIGGLPENAPVEEEPTKTWGQSIKDLGASFYNKLPSIPRPTSFWPFGGNKEEVGDDSPV